MASDNTRRTIALGFGAAAAATLVPGLAFAQEGGQQPESQPGEANPPSEQGFSEEEVVNRVSRFFGMGAELVAQAVEPIFRDQGRPAGYIEGSEGSAAIAVGLRYGEGRLYMHSQSDTTKLFWQGPSIGFDTGANAAKCFTLCYGLTDPRQIFRRFPGVEGTAYFIGGIGVNYQRAEGLTLAPMRLGVGFRLGANIGYLAYSARRRVLPF
jgi:hypothetical protein